ncbi:MAG TPA: hotdog fold thioesterase [Flavobacteriales bacterium]|nr:hotdog fold thioesterase [Flavobacteriales bacterium]HMR26611.1 hotdog fold thioesterase [Flavobacteriales bacterium]
MRFTAEHVGQADHLRAGTLSEHLDIRFGVDADGRLTASMPVDARTVQPMGLLHGGATAALAETLGSVASALLVMPEGRQVVGIEVNANHLKGVREGRVTATAEALHLGRTTHVWDIRVRNAAGALCAVCRLTNVVLPAATSTPSA